MSFLKKLNRLNSLFRGKRNFTPGKVLFIDRVEVAGDSAPTTDSVSYVTTGSDITIPKHKIDQCSELLVIHHGSMRIDIQTYTFIEIRIERTAPSTTNSDAIGLGGANANNLSEQYNNTAFFWTDDNLVYGSDHTYRLVFRNFGGAGVYAGNVHYIAGGSVMMCVGLA